VTRPDPSHPAGPADIPAGYDVFVSHSSKDREAADAVSRVLESRGIRCWMAPRDIRPGASWGESILEAIGRVKMMVLLLSNNANTSPQVLREVERAVNKSVVIIPVRIENVMPSASLEYFLSTAHWLDAFESPLEQHCRHLADTVQGMLHGKDYAPFVSASSPAAARRASRAWLLPIAGVAGVLIITALSFAAGQWWRHPQPGRPVEVVPVVASAAPAPERQPAVAPAIAPAPLVVPSPPVEAPPPALADFAGSWEISILGLEDVAGNNSYYRTMRFAVDEDGAVAGKMALTMETRDGQTLIRDRSVVVDLKGRVSRPARKAHAASGVFLDREDFTYPVAEIELTMSDGMVGKGLIAHTQGLPVVEYINFSKGDASGRMHAVRTAAMNPAPAMGLRVDPLQPDDVVPDGAWFFWFRAGSNAADSEKVAELDLSNGDLVLRINGELERLRKRSETWNPSRDRGPTVGDRGEEVWSNARVEVRLSFQVTEAEHEFSRFAGQMRVSADGQTVVLMVEGETGA
jgi:hypothetical protein